MPLIRSRPQGALLLAVVVALTTWLYTSTKDSVVAADPTPTPTQNITDLLSQVPVVDRIDHVPGYERGCGIDKKTKLREACVFGPAWNDPQDRSGCDARNRALSAALRDVKYKAGTHNCKVIAGVLDPDPYTGQLVELGDINLDHIYSLRRAWDAGAWKWDLLKRRIFANDPIELAPVSEKANLAKSDAGLDWIPSFEPCNYVTRYLTVAAKYQLPITADERNIAVRTCPNGNGK